MSKLHTDAQGRKYDADNHRVYDKAGANTWVVAVHPGTYPAGHLRRANCDPFKLAEGDDIVDWMREVEADPLDHDGDGRKGGSKPRRSPKPKPVEVEVEADADAEAQAAADAEAEKTKAAADLA